MTTCIVGEKSFLESVPERFIGQVLCQMLVTRTNFCVLVKSSEIGMLEIVVIHCSVFYLNEALKETEKNLISNRLGSCSSRGAFSVGDSKIC